MSLFHCIHVHAKTGAEFRLSLQQTNQSILLSKKKNTSNNESSGVLAASASSRPYSTQGQQLEFLPEILRTTKREVGIAGSTM